MKEIKPLFDEQFIGFSSSITSVSKKKRDLVIKSINLAFKLYDYVISNYNIIYGIKKLDIHVGNDPYEATQNIKRFYGIENEAISNVFLHIESMGFVIAYLPEDTIRACSVWRENTPFIFIDKTLSPFELRFEAIKQLGYLVLYKKGSINRQKAIDEVNDFARYYLIPKKMCINMLKRECKTATSNRLQKLGALATLNELFWRVPFTELLRTVKEYGGICDLDYHLIRKHIVRNGNEPPIYIDINEKQYLFFFERIILESEKHGESVGDICKCLNADIERLSEIININKLPLNLPFQLPSYLKVVK